MAIGLVSPRLVGRGDELADLVAALHTARQDRPTLVVLSGEAGVGKSRLLEEFLGRARDSGCRTVTGACLDISAGDLPFVPFRQMLRGLDRELGTDALAEMLGESADDLGLLLPNARPSREPRDRGGGDPARVFELVLHAVDRLTQQQPVVMAIEDAHWADRSTLHVLAYVMQGLVERPFLLVVTHRDEDLPDDVEWQGTLAELARHRAAHRIVLAGLDDDATAGLVNAISPGADADVIRYAQDWSAGVPLFVEEIVAASKAGDLDAVPRRLADMVRLRLATLSLDAQRVVACIATVGRDVDHRVVASASGLPADRLSDAAREAVGRQAVVWRPPSRYGFRHALWREVAYAQMLPADRIQMHQAIAQALDGEARRDGQADPVVLGELAFHWMQAEDDGPAFDASLAAARAAARAFAYPESARLYEHSVDLLRRLVLADDVRTADEDIREFELLSEAAEVSHWAGRTDLTQEFLARALLIADESSDESVVRRLLLDMNNDLWAARADRDQANVWIERRGDAATRAVLESGNLMVQGDYAGSAALARDALAMARGSEVPAVEIKARYLLGLDLVLIGESDEGLSHLDAAIELARDVGDRDRLVAAYANKSFALEHDGRWEDALATSLEGIEAGRSLGADASDAVLLWANAASELLRLGRLHEADELVTEAFDRRPSPGVHVLLVIYGVEISTARGRFEEATRRLDELPPAADTDDYQTVGQRAAARAELSLWVGRPEQAVPVLDDALRALGDDDVQLIARLVWLRVRAEADRLAHQPGRAEALRASAAIVAGTCVDRIGAVVARATGPGASVELAAYDRLVHAEVTRLTDPTADDPWHAAHEAWVGTPSMATYCMVQEGAALGLAGERKRAGVVLRSAVELAGRHGLGAVLAAVDGLASALRVRLDAESPVTPSPRTPEPAAQFNLTARESQVLQLLTQGLSNRRIARALSGAGRAMSESTASVHVSHILAKLGVSSRTEAAALAYRLGLVAPAPADDGVDASAGD